MEAAEPRAAARGPVKPVARIGLHTASNENETISHTGLVAFSRDRRASGQVERRTRSRASSRSHLLGPWLRHHPQIHSTHRPPVPGQPIDPELAGQGVWPECASERDYRSVNGARHLAGERRASPDQLPGDGPHRQVPGRARRQWGPRFSGLHWRAAAGRCVSGAIQGLISFLLARWEETPSLRVR
jgi:hypothetical protein